MTMFTTEMNEVPENLELRVFPTLSSELKDHVKQFRATVRDMNGRIRTPEEEVQRYEKYCSDSDIKKWILVFKNNDLIGMTVIFGRKVTYDKQSVALGGIGKVRVREDWRKKGIAETMMDEAIKQLIEMRYNVAFLSTNIDSFLSDFYKKYGFVPLNKPYTFLGHSGRRYEEHDGMLAPVTSEITFREIMDGKNPLDIGKGNW